MEYLKLSELISILQMLEEKHGDIAVAINQEDDYWGGFHRGLHAGDIEFVERCSVGGPKDCTYQPAIVLGG